jgi:hypothetical protein
MNKRINAHVIPVDENSDTSEFRLKLSTHHYLFLTIVVKENQAIASFEEEEIGSGANQSFFLYKDGQIIRSKGSHLASFVLRDETYHLYGQKTRQ